MSWRLVVTIEGARGRLRGELGDPRQGRMRARTFASALRCLRDAAAGGGGGRRQHQPLTFTKDAGPATPALAQVACSGEVLRWVLFEFSDSLDGGQEEVVFAIKLLDATISGHRMLLAEGEPARPLGEEVDLTYRRIEWEHRGARTMSADEWA